MELHVGLDPGHDFLQVLYAVGFYTICFHGIVNAVLYHGAGIHAKRLLRVAVCGDGTILRVQFRDTQQNVYPVFLEVGLDHLRVYVFKEDILSDFVILQIWSNKA